MKFNLLIVLKLCLILIILFLVITIIFFKELKRQLNISEFINQLLCVSRNCIKVFYNQIMVPGDLFGPIIMLIRKLSFGKATKRQRDNFQEIFTPSIKQL